VDTQPYPCGQQSRRNSAPPSAKTGQEAGFRTRDNSGRGVILSRADISEHPKEVKEKRGSGWEADTISGGKGLRVIVSLFD